MRSPRSQLRRSGFALVWAALLLGLLPVTAAVLIDAVQAAGVAQTVDSALIEAWEAAGAPTRLPSAAQLTEMTQDCQRTLPPSIHMTATVRATSGGLALPTTTALVIPLPGMTLLTLTAHVPIRWSP